MSLPSRSIYLGYNASTPIDPRVAAVMRPLLGTESVLLAAALGEACAFASDLRPLEQTRRLRDRLWDGLRVRFGDGVVLNGHPSERLPNTLNVSFVGRVGADVLAALDGVAASTGAACHADSVELSPVLRAMRVPPVVGMGAVRLSLGRMTTEPEIDEVLRRCGDPVLADARLPLSHVF